MKEVKKYSIDTNDGANKHGKDTTRRLQNKRFISYV